MRDYEYENCLIDILAEEKITTYFLRKMLRDDHGVTVTHVAVHKWKRNKSQPARFNMLKIMLSINRRAGSKKYRLDDFYRIYKD